MRVTHGHSGPQKQDFRSTTSLLAISSICTALIALAWKHCTHCSVLTVPVRKSSRWWMDATEFWSLNSKLSLYCGAALLYNFTMKSSSNEFSFMDSLYEPPWRWHCVMRSASWSYLKVVKYNQKNSTRKYNIGGGGWNDPNQASSSIAVYFFPWLGLTKRSLIECW